MVTRDRYAAFLFLFAAITGALGTIPYDPLYDGITRWNLATVAFDISPFLFGAASLLLFFGRRFAYAVSLSAGLFALPLLVWTEYSPDYWSAWVFLNSGLPKPEGEYLINPLLKILIVALMVFATTLSLLRLAPTRWQKRGVWPAWVMSSLVLASWFLTSAIPYNIAVISHPGRIDFRILHIRKRGLRINETTLIALGDYQLYVKRQERRLFQYQFTSMGSMAKLGESPTARPHMREFVTASQLWKYPPSEPRLLRSWNAEGWYVVLKDTLLLSFESEDKAVPPAEVVPLFNELAALPTQQEKASIISDVCLGFCYDPVAALGFVEREKRNQLLTGQRGNQR